MNAFQFTIGGLTAILMAENEEHAIQKLFGHLHEARKDVSENIKHGDRPIATGTLYYVGEPENIIVAIEIWPDEVKFVPPNGKAN